MRGTEEVSERARQEAEDNFGVSRDALEAVASEEQEDKILPLKAATFDNEFEPEIAASDLWLSFAKDNETCLSELTDFLLLNSAFKLLSRPSLCFGKIFVHIFVVQACLKSLRCLSSFDVPFLSCRSLS